MSLSYKSCIFCDVIFDISTPHVCETGNPPSVSFHKIDNKIETNTGIINETESKTATETNMLIVKRPKPATDSIKKQVESDEECINNKEIDYLPKKPPRKQLVVNDDIPSQKELYSLVLELTKKCDKLQQEVINVKQQLSNRLKRDIADYLQYDQRSKYTFLEWVTSFNVTDEILTLVFNTDLTDGIRKCIEDRIENEGVFSIPIRVFKEKPDWIFIYTNEPIKNTENKNDSKNNSENEKIKCVPVEIQLGVNPQELLKTPVWRMVSKSNFQRVKEYVNEHILKKFYIWEAENEPKMKHSTEKMDILASYMLKVIGHGSKQKKERQNAELYKWFFSKMAIA